MNDFDDQARAAGERARRTADDIAPSTDPMARVHPTSVDEGHRRRRWLLVAAALIVVAGVAGLVVVNTRGVADIDNVDGIPASTDAAVTTEVASTSSAATTGPSTTAESPTTTSEPAPITRPIIDPTLCTPISAFDGDPSGLPRDPNSNLPVTLFTRGSDFPIQVIGERVDGQAKPFAMVLRYFGRPADRMFQLEPVDIDGTQVYVSTFENGNGNGEAEWTLPDGSVGYLRSRGLDREQLISILGQLTPRPADAPVNGFDYGGDGPDGLELVAERMNTEPWGGTAAGSQCIVEATGRVYRLAMYTNEPTLMYAAVIDRPPPADVGVIDGSVIVVSGPDAPGAPSAADVVDADEITWQRLLDAPGIDDRFAYTFTVGEDIEIPFVPIDATSTPASSLTLRVAETDGVAFLETYRSGAVIADAAEYWKLEIDERIRSRSTAIPGPGRGVVGTRLGDVPITAPFFVEVSTTDGDDQTIQTTGLVQLVPIP